jgi:tRNA threonylcarbamoyladenosine biosynthesis protein TsaE
MTLRLDLADAAMTDALGAALAKSRPERGVVHLVGDLGAGKSTLARALLRALGVQGTIRSPTYTLVERYPLAEGEAAHLDLYRLADASELDFLALDELESSASLWLVEWPERGAGHLPPADLVLRLAVRGSGREALLEPAGSVGAGWLERLEEGLWAGALGRLDG